MDNLIRSSLKRSALISSLLGLLALLAPGCCTEAVAVLASPEVSIVREGFPVERCVFRIKNVANFPDGMYGLEISDSPRIASDVAETRRQLSARLQFLRDSTFLDPWDYDNVVLYRGDEEVVEVEHSRAGTSTPDRLPPWRPRIGISIKKDGQSIVRITVLLEDVNAREWLAVETIDCGEGSQHSLRWLETVPLWPCAFVVDAVTGPFQVAQGCLTGKCIGPL